MGLPDWPIGCTQAFLFGDKILGLARITGWQRARSGEVQVLIRYYKKPEETHLGRQVGGRGGRRGDRRCELQG